MSSDIMDDLKKTYERRSLEFVGKSNSLHSLGFNSKKLEDASTNQILNVLKLDNREVIYTSGKEENYTLILNNIPDDKKIVTDNKCFYEIGKDMNKNIVFDKDLNVSNDIYLISTENDRDLKRFNCLKHVSLEENYTNYSYYDFITIDDLLPFFGCLIKNKNKVLNPIIHGGKSTTIYRSGTAATSLIATFSKSVKNKYNK